MQEGFAHEEDVFLREMHGQVAPGVRAPEEEDLDGSAPQLQHFAFVHQPGGKHHWRRGAGSAGGVGAGLQRPRRSGVGDELRVGREGGVAGGMVAVVGADHDVRDRAVGYRGDVFDEPLGLRDIALAVRHQDALVGDHEHADGGEALVARGAQRLVGVDPVGKFAQPREVLLGVAARKGVGSARKLTAHAVGGLSARGLIIHFSPGSAAREARQSERQPCDTDREPSSILPLLVHDRCSLLRVYGWSVISSKVTFWMP